MAPSGIFLRSVPISIRYIKVRRQMAEKLNNSNIFYICSRVMQRCASILPSHTLEPMVPPARKALTLGIICCMAYGPALGK